MLYYTSYNKSLHRQRHTCNKKTFDKQHNWFCLRSPTTNTTSLQSAAPRMALWWTVNGVDGDQPIEDVTARAVATGCIVFVRVLFLCAQEPLHLAYFAWTCSLATAWNPEDFKVIGQGTGFFSIATLNKKACTHDNPWSTALSLMVFWMYLDDITNPI